jgi:hypothetical protein
MGLKISRDAIVFCTSGLTDGVNGMIISHLNKAIRPINQLRMLEDATVVYFIARAPERRVFYIDVGNLPKLKAEQYLKDIMNRYRNKVVYDAKTGDVKNDKKYMSMLEDFWMPRRDGCFSLDTKIKLLDGRNVELGQLIVEHKLGKVNWVYSVSPTGKVVPGKISWAGVTRTDAEVLDVYLDNGEVITATPDHKFILRNGEKIEAQYLQAGSSLMPLYTENKIMYGDKDYEYLLDNESNKWITTHSMSSDFINVERTKSDVIHHENFNRFDNTPTNLRKMTKQDHLDLHAGYNSVWKTEEAVLKWKKALSESGKAFFDTEEGQKRKLEISENNKTCEAIWKGLATGRSKIKEIREFDKNTLSHEEYLLKWSKGLDKFNKAGTAHINKATDEKYSKYDIALIVEIIKKIDKQYILNKDIISNVSVVYPDFKESTLRYLLKRNGYDSIGEFLAKNISEDKIQPNRLYSVKSNHKVLKVVRRTDKIDVGTLTIDENHEYHDYHNFALSSGIFVMNSKGTQIESLPGAQNITGYLDSLTWFKEKMYESLNIPKSRLQQENGFSLGQSTSISRDEVTFQKFIDRLRNKFSQLLYDTLSTQLSLKGIVSKEEWNEIKPFIKLNFQKDNYFSELKEQEIWTTRFQMLSQVDNYLQKYISKEWVQRNILQMNDDDIVQMDKQMKKEAKDEACWPDWKLQGQVQQEQQIETMQTQAEISQEQMQQSPQPNQ